MKSLLLLALVVSLRRMVVSCFGFIGCLSRLLLCTHMIIAAVLLRVLERRLRFVAVFLAAYTASHKPACSHIRGVPDANHNGGSRINRRGHLQRADLRQHDDLSSSRSVYGPGLRTILVEPQGRLCEHSVSSIWARWSGASCVEGGWPTAEIDRLIFAARSCGLQPWIETYSSGKGFGQSPYLRKWKRTCSS